MVQVPGLLRQQELNRHGGRGLVLGIWVLPLYQISRSPRGEEVLPWHHHQQHSYRQVPDYPISQGNISILPAANHPALLADMVNYLASYTHLCQPWSSTWLVIHLFMQSFTELFIYWFTKMLCEREWGFLISCNFLVFIWSWKIG